MQGIAPTLIVARVALGVNLKESTWIPSELVHSGGDLRSGPTSGIAQDRTTTIFPDNGRHDSVPMESMHRLESV
jgi:hypothetical protein